MASVNQAEPGTENVMDHPYLVFYLVLSPLASLSFFGHSQNHSFFQMKKLFLVFYECYKSLSKSRIAQPWHFWFCCHLVDAVSFLYIFIFLFS